MKALVLGGCGFIGSHLVDRLLAEGHRVRVFDRSQETYREPRCNVEYRQGDFVDASLLAEALEGIDVVYHLISTTVPSTSNLNPIADVNSNLAGTLNLLQLMVQKGIKKIIFLSSGGTVYGLPESVPIPETHPLRPICSYGVVKVAIENYLHMFHHLYGLEYVIFRASNPYGERQGHIGVQGVIGTFMGNILANEPIDIWGDGRVVRDFIYVGDLSELCVLAADPKKFGTYNAGSGVGYSINDIVGVLSAVSGHVLEPRYRVGRVFDVPRVVLDISKGANAFEWAPEVSLLDGIARTWDWRSSMT